MSSAPDYVEEQQLRDLNIRIVPEEKDTDQNE